MKENKSFNRILRNKAGEEKKKKKSLFFYTLQKNVSAGLFVLGGREGFAANRVGRQSSQGLSGQLAVPAFYRHRNRMAIVESVVLWGSTVIDTEMPLPRSNEPLIIQGEIMFCLRHHFRCLPL